MVMVLHCATAGTMGDDEMRQLNVPALQDDGYIFLWVTGIIVCSQWSVVQSVRGRREASLLSYMFVGGKSVHIWAVWSVY